MENSRRNFLMTALAAALPLRARTLSPQEFQRQLDGPILSVPTVYTSKFEIDTAGMRKMIDGALAAGVRVVSLTAGNSQYDRLTYDEIRQLTRSMVEIVGGRAITIAATGPWWTGQAVDYACHAASVGADAVQVMTPPQGSEQALLRHYSEVARAVRLPLVLHGQPPLPVLKQLLTIDSLVAMKEEFTTMYTLPIYAHFGTRVNIFAGGTKARLLMYRPYGMHAYYSTFATFAPAIAARFWKAVSANNSETVREIVLRYDVPFFEKWTHAFWRGTLEYFGVAKRYQRPPDPVLSDQEMAELGAFYKVLGLA